MLETMESLARVAELYSENMFQPPSRSLLKAAYEAELLEQFRSCHTPDEELYRSLWLDCFRWMCLYRVKSLAFGVPVYPLYRDLLTLITNSFYDPWCNYTMTRGWRCDRCPLVQFNAVQWEPKTTLSVESFFMRCRLRNPITKKAIYFEQFFRGRSNMEKTVFTDWIQEQMTTGTAVKVFKALKQGSNLFSQEVSNVR